MKQIIKTGSQNLKLFLLVLAALAFAGPSFSQGNDSKGTDFWLMFNTNLGTPTLTLFITGDANTTGTVTVPGLAFSAPFTVVANTVTPVVIPNSAATHTNGVIDTKGIHVVAQNEVTVYGLNYIPFTTDAYLGLPTDVLGTDYIVLTYGGMQIRSEIGIVATQNATTVTITPNILVAGHPAGVPYSIIMNQGQTYEIGNVSDLTGTIITSSAPIGVFGANACANIPPNAVYCDHICEMLPPTTTWGKKFGTVPLKTRINGDTWRFIASENATVVNINGVAQPPINRGQFLERILTTQSVIESNKPILTAQYANGSGFSGNPGDPFMMLIPPLEQFLAKYTLTTVTGYVAHHINVVAPASIVGTLTMDGVVIPPASFTPIGATGFSGAQITVTPGTHNFQGTLPFGVFQYGFNNDDSYGYPGGQSFSAVATVTTVELTPETGTAPVGTNQCWNALVKDQFNNPVPGVRVDFGITGANPGSSGFAFTNASGIAQFCFTGANDGTDNIVASVGTITDNATFIWTPAVQQNVYYSKAAGDLHNVLTWGVNPDGSGANPPDFTAGKTFILANRPGVYTMTADWSVGGLLMNSAGSQLQINGFSLRLANWSGGGGTISGSTSSKLTIWGPETGDAGLLSFTPGSNTLEQLIIDRPGPGGSATLGNALNVWSVLFVNFGTLNTGNFLTLKSDVFNTARVAPVPVSANILGSVTVERYIPARRAWRIMGAPTSGPQTISQSWQEGATTASPVPNPFPGYGCHVTGGPVFGSLANGFDQNPGAQSSIKTYNSAVDNWQAVPNTNATTVGSAAYMLFIRGNRGIPIGLNTVPPAITTLRTKGPLKIGDQVFPVSATGFTAIPNPYASNINFATLTRSNVQNSFWLWDPKMGGLSGVGAYVNLSFNGVGYDITPAPVSPESQYIQSGQGFLVKSEGGVPGTLTIKESDKSATPSMDVFRMANNSKGIRVNLQVINADNTTSMLDEVFSSYSNTYNSRIDAFDAVKLPNIEENIAIVSQGENLMVERRPIITASENIYLKIWNTTPKSYVMEFKPSNISSTGLYAYLIDNYLHTSTEVALDRISQVYFKVSTDPASANPDRFRIEFSATKKAGPAITRASEIKAYPNPLVSRTLNLEFVNEAKGTYQLTLVNSLGQVVMRREIKHEGGSVTQPLVLDKKLSKGLYQLQITGGEENRNIKLTVN